MAENNKNLTSAKSADKKPNFFVRFGKKIAKLCKDTVGELKKVVWTSRSEVWKSFELVIATVVAISVIIAIVDYTSSLIINTLASLIG
ncbi:MAG: preprotein translocase subunit SecE [Ruminococcaceae bacterium]|nr:preprotein translocase subunit SecE [Oscillospiraceae bacterium]